MVVVNIIFAIAVSYRLFLAFQQSGYRKLGLSQYNNRTIQFGIISLVLATIGMILDILFHDKNLFYLFGAIILIIQLLQLIPIYKSEYIKPLVFTNRLLRLLVIYTLILIAFNMLYFTLIRCLIWAVYILLPIFIKLSYHILRPLENKINNRYIAKAKRALDRDDLLRIGITGSFGKTTNKNILAEILSYSYRVVATPHSFNTPLGIARSVADIKSDTEIFIAEMGARRIGDIKQLCDIVGPEIAIITGVNNQHQETFKTIENTYSTKYELVENLRGRKLAVFNGDNQYTYRMSKLGLATKSISVGSEDHDAVIRNIKTSTTGTQFELLYNNRILRLFTRLLGRHNSLNIALCTVVALELGMEEIDIITAVANISPIEHRLQLINGARGITIIDDSYNCNPDGAMAALEVLKDFDTRRVIITPGMVELGDMTYQENRILGERIARVADVIILIRSNMTGAIVEGLGDFNKDNIHQYNSLKEATTHFNKLLKGGDTLLILNDLPDSVGGLI